MTPELHRPFKADRVGAGGLRVLVEANAAERAALAGRLALDRIDALTCHFVLRREHGERFIAEGKLSATVAPICVITLDPFDTEIAEDFVVRFVPEGEQSEAIDLEAPDEVGYSGGVIDLGEAAAEQLALAIDPFPRGPGAPAEAAEEAEPTGPFAALRGLRRPS